MFDFQEHFEDFKSGDVITGVIAVGFYLQGKVQIGEPWIILRFKVFDTGVVDMLVLSPTGKVLQVPFQKNLFQRYVPDPNQE
jgi:hypothetical protein